MKIILDTHIYLWALSAPEKLSEEWLFELKRTDNVIYFSAVSVAEIMIKKSLRKLDFEFDPNELAKEAGFELLEFKCADALRLGELPFHHKDPFDRMLIAQSLARGFRLMTSDSKFSAYECKLV